MPIYEYQCERCESHFEVLQRVGDDGSELHCPECGHEKAIKQFSAFATSGESHGFSSSGRSSGCGSGGFS